MIPAVVASAARRRFAGVARQNIVQKRSMGGGPAPEWEGIDKVVRGYFPQDHQLAMAILGGYTGLYLIVKMKSAVSGKKVEEAVAAPASSGAVATTGIPAVDSPDFDKYLETDAFYKMLESEDQLSKVVADMK